MIAIVNYGLGNLGSLLNMFRRIGVQASLENDPEIILKANKLVLPGVGAFDTAIRKINKQNGLREVLNHKAKKDKVPILGICLGMQILTNSSEEGKSPGFGWIPAKTLKFPQNKILKVPHMGWNTTKIMYQNSLTNNINENARYYFVHSYYVKVDQKKFSLMKTNYGIDFDSAILKDNIFGVQFHPEKSHKFGIEILKNFSKL